jgi:hypothetical protein
LDQWNKLKSLVDDIDEEIKKLKWIIDIVI